MADVLVPVWALLARRTIRIGQLVNDYLIRRKPLQELRNSIMEQCESQVEALRGHVSTYLNEGVRTQIQVYVSNAKKLCCEATREKGLAGAFEQKVTVMETDAGYD